MKFDKPTARNLFLLICGVILFYFLLNNIIVIYQSLKFIIRLFFPFILGAAIAFVLNVPLKKIENLLLDKTKIKPKFARLTALVLSFVLVLGLLIFVIFMVVPAFIGAMGDLITALPGMFTTLANNFVHFLERFPVLADQIGSIEENINLLIETLRNGISNSMSGIVTIILGVLNSTIGTIFNIFVGIVFSIYLLLSKESLKQHFYKILFAFLPDRMANYVLDFLTLCNYVFSQFLTGQILEAFINGGLFFLAATLFNMPYKIVIAVFMGFSALIPYFGAIIGTVIAVLLIASQSFSQAIIFLVAATVIQQIDGNIIYPRVVGNQIGLPAIWVLVAVTIGASLWGIVGMVVMVPLASVVYAMFTMWVNRRLIEQGIDIQSIKPRQLGFLFPKKDGADDDYLI